MGPHHSGSITRTAGRKPLSMICHLMVEPLQAQLGENLPMICHLMVVPLQAQLGENLSP